MCCCCLNELHFFASLVTSFTSPDPDRNVVVAALLQNRYTCAIYQKNGVLNDPSTTHTHQHQHTHTGCSLRTASAAAATTTNNSRGGEPDTKILNICSLFPFSLVCWLVLRKSSLFPSPQAFHSIRTRSSRSEPTPPLFKRFVFPSVDLIFVTS